MQKIVGLFVIAELIAALTALMATPFTWLGWNFGIVHAFPNLGSMGWSGAFFASLFVSNFMSMARASSSPMSIDFPEEQTRVIATQQPAAK